MFHTLFFQYVAHCYFCSSYLQWKWFSPFSFLTLYYKDVLWVCQVQFLLFWFEYNCCYHRDLSVNFHYLPFPLYQNLICTDFGLDIFVLGRNTNRQTDRYRDCSYYKLNLYIIFYSLGNQFLLLRYQLFVVYLEIQRVSGPLGFVEEICTSVSGCCAVIYLFSSGKDLYSV